MAAELAKQDEYRTKVAMAIVAMSSTLRSYGKQDDESLLAGWMTGLASRKFPVELIEKTAEWYCGFADDMPTPRQFIERGLEMQARLDMELTLEATKQQAKEEDQAKILALQERFPQISPQIVRDLFEQVHSQFGIEKRKRYGCGRQLTMAQAEAMVADYRKMRDRPVCEIAAMYGIGENSLYNYIGRIERGEQW